MPVDLLGLADDDRAEVLLDERAAEHPRDRPRAGRRARSRRSAPVCSASQRAAIRVPLPDSSACEPSGFQITIVEPVVAAAGHLEDAVGVADLGAHGVGRRAAPQRRGRRSPAPASAHDLIGELLRWAVGVERSGDRAAGEATCAGSARGGGVAATTASTASSSGSVANASRPSTLRAVAESGCAHAARRLRDDAVARPARATRASMRRSSSSGVELEPDERRRVAHVVGPEPVLGRRERRAGVGQLERAHDAAAVVRVHARGGGGVALGEQRVRPLGADAS